MLKKSTFLIAIATTHLLGCTSFSTFSTEKAGDLHRDPVAIDAFYKRFTSASASDPTPMYWLSKNVDSLPALFRYEYSRRLEMSGLHERALNEVAKARLLRDMDLEHCANKKAPRVTNVLFLTDNIETWIHGSESASNPLWLNAIGDALAWKKTYAMNYSSYWICGANNVRDADMQEVMSSIRASQARYKFLKEDYEKIKAASAPK
ncbi:MAG TPA: hypothetical protein VFW68_11030 [Rhodocyclaceae bacterium]|nr:hypothetical protein [Rhodocyclaceae bacterium]